MNRVTQLIDHFNNEFKQISKSLAEISYRYTILLEIVDDLNLLVNSDETDYVREKYYETIVKKAERIGLKLQQKVTQSEREETHVPAY
jgi:hypothetical protein